MGVDRWVERRLNVGVMQKECLRLKCVGIEALSEYAWRE